MEKTVTAKTSKPQTPGLDNSRFPDLLAAIDMGSNSFRLEIAELSKGKYKRIDYLKETVRLGAGLDSHGMLTEEATQRGLACLAGARRGHANPPRGPQPRRLLAARRPRAGPFD
jgi:exopolyphosphatase/guanosine-5'-triphosphate,3'-diphosphate pyrophosphatase